MTAVDVDALDALREADVTPGAWTVRFDHKEDDHPHWDQVWIEAAGATVATLGERYTSAPRDAALIVAAVNALPDLIAEVRRGRALREAVEGLTQEWLASSALGLSALAGAGRELRRALATVDGEQ